MRISEELFAVAEELESKGTLLKDPQFMGPLDKLEAAANQTGKSWSTSWFGYHSRVYYADWQPPPPGAHFSQEWGLMHQFTKYTTGDWREYAFDDVVNVISHIAGDPDISKCRKTSAEVCECFEEAQTKVLSCVSQAVQARPRDAFLKNLEQEVQKQKILSDADFVKCCQPKGNAMSRDVVAIEKGFQTPPHIHVLAMVSSIRQPVAACVTVGKQSRRIASHLANQEQRQIRRDRVGTNVFIGHGQSPIWKGLKDFVQDRLQLPWDEFNRVPVAGVANISRLLEMLDEAAIAFLVMTAEDERPDGKFHARLNVVHEAGLFQGRLGFDRAIILLEEGCEQFSNIEGLGQIRFPKGNIGAVFENVRQVIEREGLGATPPEEDTD